MSRLQQGYALEDEIRKSLDVYRKKGWNFYYHKIPDTRSYTLLRCNRCENSITRCPHCDNSMRSNLVMPETIGDFIIIGDLGVVFLEAKSTGKAHFPIPNIKKHQRLTAVQINAHDSAQYFFFVNDRARPRHFRLFMVDAEKMDDAIEATGTPRTQLPWSELQKVSTELKRAKGLWDLGALVQLVAKPPETSEEREARIQARKDRRIMTGAVGGNKFEAFFRTDPIGKKVMCDLAEEKAILAKEYPDIGEPGPYELVKEGSEGMLDELGDNCVYIATGNSLKARGFSEDEILIAIKDMQVTVRFMRSVRE